MVGCPYNQNWRCPNHETLWKYIINKSMRKQIRFPTPIELGNVSLGFELYL